MATSSSTPPYGPGLGVGTSDQVAPFQCRTRGFRKSPYPTAHTSVGDAAATPESPPVLRSFTSVHADPSQCSISPLPAVKLSPTAHTSVFETAASPNNQVDSDAPGARTIRQPPWQVFRGSGEGAAIEPVPTETRRPMATATASPDLRTPRSQQGRPAMLLPGSRPVKRSTGPGSLPRWRGGSRWCPRTVAWP